MAIKGLTMLNDMKISTRLMLLLFLSLAGLIQIGAVGLYAASRTESALESVYNEKMKPLMRLAAIAKANLGNRLAIANATIQPENMADYIQVVEKNKELIDKRWEAFMVSVTDEENKALAAKFAEVRGRFVEEGIKPALAAMRANNAAEIRRIQIEHVNPLYAPLFEALDALIEVEKRDAKKLYEESATTYENMRMLSIVLILIGAVLLGALGLSIIRGVHRSVDELRGVMVKMSADGDLMARARIYGQDEIGQAATAFNALIDGFAGIIRQVIGHAGTVSGTAAQLSAATSQISQGSQAQSEAAASTAAAVEQITVSINSVAANTEDVRKLSEKSLSQTRQGNQNVTEMIGEIHSVQEAVNQIANSVKEFVDSTRAIAGMTQQVKEIADQTNLLALNAAIEAARAGEQGRGFAVVADEVRSLAERTQNSLTEINATIQSINQATADASSEMNHQTEVFGKLTKTATDAEKVINHTATLIAQVSEVVGKTAQVALNVQGNIQEITGQIRQIDEFSKSNASSVDELAAVSDRMRDMAVQLGGKLEAFST